MNEDREQQPLLSPDEEESDLSSLLGLTISDVIESMSQEEATTYITSLLEGAEIDTDPSLFARVTPQVTPTMSIPDYRPDQAFREASLARKDRWQPAEGAISYHASNTLEVYLGTPQHPLELPQALKQIRQLSESTVLTARIILGLWNTRRHNAR